MKKSLRWQAFSNQDRNSVLDAVKEAISASDGCILHFNMFSDLGISLCIEIEENKIIALHQSLGLLLNVSKLEPTELNPESKKERLVFMNISFGQGKGRLKKEVPNVPG